MFYNLLRSLIVIVVLRLVRCETSKDTLQDVSPKSTLKSNLDYVPTPDSWDNSKNQNSLWIYRPSTYYQSSNLQETEPYPDYTKEPFLVTRLAKALTFGFDPYFMKGYFEPFERRSRPVTLVGFRRNGWLPKSSVKVEEIQSENVAEMQSPYNEISSFWLNKAGLNE